MSIVAAPCRRLVSVARWNGHAAQVTTGVVSANASHCHPSNCSADAMDSTSTGRLSAAAVTSRGRYEVSTGWSADGSVAV